MYKQPYAYIGGYISPYTTILPLISMHTVKLSSARLSSLMEAITAVRALLWTQMRDKHRVSILMIKLLYCVVMTETKK